MALDWIEMEPKTRTAIHGVTARFFAEREFQGEVIEAKAGEHQGDKARLMPKLIDPGRLYNGLSTGRSLAAAMELTVKLGYSLIDPNK